ncbi:MAG: carbohydrate ABC transporter permease [Deinococcales bacterium]
MKRFSLSSLVGTVFTLIMAGIWIFPIYWAVVTSLKNEEDVLTTPPEWLPRPLSFQAYSFVILKSPILRWYLNSAIVSLGTTFLVILLCMMCAYALSQLDFPGKNFLYWLLLAGFMIPGQALIVPLYQLVASQLKSVFPFIGSNTYLGMILPQVISVIVIIVYKQFFDAVPRELRDSAAIDGAGSFRILFNIYLPINWGITWALAIVTFIGVWNSFFWPFLITTKTDMMTIPVGITQTQDAFGVRYARTMATAILAGLPVVAFYLIFQRRVTEGIMMTAGLKG